MIDEKAAAILDSPNQFAVMSTIEPDGQPHSSVLWYERDGDTLLLSTTTNRRKYRNLERDPRATVLVYDKENPYQYVEIRGHVEMTEEGGRELIDKLAADYMGADRYPFDDGTDNVRTVVRLIPDKVVVLAR